MPSHRHLITDYIDRGVIPAEQCEAALGAARIRPGGAEWRRFADRLMLWLGILSLAFALMFFIAYNWNDMGRFAKFGIVEGAMVLAVFAYFRSGGKTVAGKASILGASMALGVLLALYGQTYQTGADTWQLFFSWGMLMLPWTVIARLPAMWILWAALMNTAIVLYGRTFGGLFGMIDGFNETTWTVFAVNTLLLVVWELLSIRVAWLNERWAVRLLAVGSGVPLTWLVMAALFDHTHDGIPPFPVWAVWMGVMVGVYRMKRLDLFMLAGFCLSGITVTVSFLGETILDHDEAGGFLLIALVIIGMGTGSAFWLNRVNREVR
jgi:uncharacterized membrane protein